MRNCFKLASARTGLIVLAVAILFWFQIEDTNSRTAQILALFTSSLFALHSFERYHNTALSSLAGMGLASGIMVSLIAISLMIFKSGLHGHGIPDFSIEDIIDVAKRTPFYAVSGLSIGAGLHYYFYAE